jgi:hypothetical protein
MYMLWIQKPSVCWTTTKSTATNTSLHVSFLLWLLVLRPEIRLLDAQASPATRILARGTTERLEVLGTYSENNVSRTVGHKFVGLEEEDLAAGNTGYRY